MAKDFDKFMRELYPGDETLEELKASAFEVLLLNPGCEQSDWAQILVEQYGTELIDAYGTDPAEIYSSLADLWESPYYDENIGQEHSYQEWALTLWTDEAVQMYHDFCDTMKECKKLKAEAVTAISQLEKIKQIIE